MEKINTYIIPILNNYKGLYRLLITLEKYTPDNYKVIVINNGFSLKDNPKYDDNFFVEEAKKKVNLWINPNRNLGFAKAMNTGIKLSDTEFITLANDDVEIMYTGWWDEVMNKFNEDLRLGGFNPHSPCNKMHTGERCIQYDYKEEFTSDDILKMKDIFKGEREYTGCCTYFTICRKQMFDEIGLFDESFGIGSGEDYDLCVRTYRGGWSIKGGSSCMVWHWWGNTKDNMPKTDDYITNYDLIVKGNQNMERKWGKHIDKDPQGWSVSGRGGPKIPYDSESGIYKERGKWYQEIEL